MANLVTLNMVLYGVNYLAILFLASPIIMAIGISSQHLFRGLFSHLG